MTPEAYTVAGIAITAIFGFFGVRYTANQSRRAQEASIRTEEKAVDAAAYARARESYEASIARYLEDIRVMDERCSSLSRRLVELNKEIETLEQNKREQRYDLEATIGQLIEQRQEFLEHIRFCNSRVERLRHRIQAGESLTLSDPDLQVTPIVE